MFFGKDGVGMQKTEMEKVEIESLSFSGNTAHGQVALALEKQPKINADEHHVFAALIKRNSVTHAEAHGQAQFLDLGSPSQQDRDSK